MKDACKESCAFVRQTKGRWYEVAENVAREKISYVFRDLLADRYESSSTSKVAKRVQRRQQQQHLQSHQDHSEEEEDDEVISSLPLSNSQKDYVDNINDKECNAITCNSLMISLHLISLLISPAGWNERIALNLRPRPDHLADTLLTFCFIYP